MLLDLKELKDHKVSRGHKEQLVVKVSREHKVVRDSKGSLEI